MAGKKVWVTWLPEKENEAELQQTLQQLQMVGLEVSGAPWIDDLEKCVWTELAEMLSAEDGPELWLIAGRTQDFNNQRIRYGLSLLLASLSQSKQPAKIFSQCIDGALPTLPTLCQHFTPLDAAAGWNAKVVAAAYISAPQVVEPDYYLTVIAHSAIGQWFEVGPNTNDAPWAGAMFGIIEGDAKITFQAVGERGQLPEKSVNKFPSMGIKAEIGGDEFVACALQNDITGGQSYYVKITGFPSKIFFAGHPGSDQAEVQVITLS
ncbi:hypothetical protein QX776_07620 [Alteromonadaceae bacterium BrNp21-10]|nr:hypothetical protein [Alteromonadaceae bacterium BrNp21-10]